MLYVTAILLKTRFNACPPLQKNTFIILLYYSYYLDKNDFFNKDVYFSYVTYGIPCIYIDR